MKTPEVKLINYTQNALELLIYTKSSRLETGTTLAQVMAMPMSKKLLHLDYMMNTIKTSFEFVDYTFEIKNVSRAFTHQVVRTRTASFQQQTMRAVDVRNHDFNITCALPEYESACQQAIDAYADLLDMGIQVQDARGVLPTAIHTEIIMKANLRTLSQMAETRLCKRTQGEYQDVFKMIIQEVLNVHPWADPLLQCFCVKNATCAFPRYTRCPVQKFCINPVDHRDKIKRAWAKSNHVANPVVNKDGMTM